MTATCTALVVIAAVCGAVYAPPDVLARGAALAGIVGLIMNLNIEEPDE